MRILLPIVVILIVLLGTSLPAGTLSEQAAEAVAQTSEAVPEPASLLLFGAGILGLAALGKRKGQR